MCKVDSDCTVHREIRSVNSDWAHDRFRQEIGGCCYSWCFLRFSTALELSALNSCLVSTAKESNCTVTDCGSHVKRVFRPLAVLLTLLLAFSVLQNLPSASRTCTCWPCWLTCPYLNVTPWLAVFFRKKKNCESGCAYHGICWWRCNTLLYLRTAFTIPLYLWRWSAAWRTTGYDSGDKWWNDGRPCPDRPWGMETWAIDKGNLQRTSGDEQQQHAAQVPLQSLGESGAAASSWRSICLYPGKWRMLQHYWKFQSQNVLIFGNVYQSTNGPNHGPVRKIQSFLLKGICAVILWQDLLWEKQFEKILLKHGWERVPNWECLFVHREKRIILICVCGCHKIGW